MNLTQEDRKFICKVAAKVFFALARRLVTGEHGNVPVMQDLERAYQNILETYKETT